MATALSAFFPWVLPSVPGCSDPAAEQAVRDACIEFCEKSDLVQRILPADVVAGTQDYTVTPPTDMQIGRYLKVFVQGVEHSVVPIEDVTSDVALRGAAIGTETTDSGQSQWFFLKTPTATAVSVYPIPDTAITQGMTLKVSFKPTRTAATVEDVLFNEYVEEIAAGAISRLMQTPGQPFSSINTLSFDLKFAAGIRAAKIRRTFGNTAINARVQPVSFVF